MNTNSASALTDRNATKSLEYALDAVYREPEVAAPAAVPKPPKVSAVSQTSASETGIFWSHNDFGTLSASVQGIKMGIMQKDPSAVWAPVLCGQLKIPSLFLSLEATPADGIEIFHAAGGRVSELTQEKIPALQVGVDWQNQAGQNIPHTRETDRDNIDIVFLNGQGAFIQLQISISSRGGKLWVAVQEIYAGQVVRATAEEARGLKDAGTVCLELGKHHALVVPRRPENAFPGSDYLKIFPKMGPVIVTYAVAAFRSIMLSACTVPEWAPAWPDNLSERMKRNNWQPGVVRYFNLVLGTGFVELEDGSCCFVHFKALQDKDGLPIWSRGEFPSLPPMSGVAVKCSPPDDRSRVRATGVRTTAGFFE